MIKGVEVLEGKKSKSKFIRFIPLIIMIGLFLFFTINYGNISIEDILNFTPSNYFLTAALIILIYAVKSVSMFISLSILYISVGILFPGLWAITINLLGLFVCMSIPYWIGRFSGSALLEKVAEKYPKINNILEIEEDNEWILVFLIKILGFIPNEPSSLALGSIDIRYGSYITAAVLAKTPSMIATTLLGANINKPGTPEFTWSIIISIIIFIGIGLIYKKNKYRFKV